MIVHLSLLSVVQTVRKSTQSSLSFRSQSTFFLAYLNELSCVASSQMDDQQNNNVKVDPLKNRSNTVMARRRAISVSLLCCVASRTRMVGVLLALNVLNASERIVVVVVLLLLLFPCPSSCFCFFMFLGAAIITKKPKAQKNSHISQFQSLLGIPSVCGAAFASPSDSNEKFRTPPCQNSK